MERTFNGLPVSILHFDAKGNVTKEEHFNHDNIEISDWHVEALARSLLPDILEYYSHEENIREFEKWQKEQKNQRKSSS